MGVWGQAGAMDSLEYYCQLGQSMARFCVPMGPGRSRPTIRTTVPIPAPVGCLRHSGITRLPGQQDLFFQTEWECGGEGEMPSEVFSRVQYHKEQTPNSCSLPGSAVGSSPEGSGGSSSRLASRETPSVVCLRRLGCALLNCCMRCTTSSAAQGLGAPVSRGWEGGGWASLLGPHSGRKEQGVSLLPGMFQSEV